MGGPLDCTASTGSVVTTVTVSVHASTLATGSTGSLSTLLGQASSWLSPSSESN